MAVGRKTVTRQSCKYRATRRAQWRIGLLFPNRQARKPLSVIDGVSDVHTDSFVFSKFEGVLLLDCTFLAILRQSQKPAFHCGVRVQPRPIRAQPAACYRTLESPCNTLRRPRARRNTPLEGSSTCADHTTTNKIRSGRRPAVEQPRFRGSNRMLPKNGGRSHQYAPENTRPKMRPEQDQGGSVHGRIAGGRIVVVRRRQSPKRRRASWQASSPGKHTRQTCGLSA